MDSFYRFFVIDKNMNIIAQIESKFKIHPNCQVDCFLSVKCLALFVPEPIFNHKKREFLALNVHFQGTCKSTFYDLVVNSQ